MFEKSKNLLKIYTLSLLLGTALFAAPSDISVQVGEDGFIMAKSKENNDTAPSLKQDNDFLSARFGKIATVAKELIGTRYRFGGTSPKTGFDCSGFVSYVFKEGADIKLPRSSREMRTIGKAVDLKSLKPGDLIFFKINTSHVGIYIGNNKFIHAPSTGRSVAVDNLMSSFFQDRVLGARRVIEE